MLIFGGIELDKQNYKYLKKIYKYALKVNHQKYRVLETNVNIVYSDEMQELNLRTRKIDYATDVLSFPNLENIFNKTITRKEFSDDINPETKKVMLGDIVINIDKAEEQAGSFGHSLSREICYLFVHGLLHLLSYDHIDENDQIIMRNLEELILSKFNLKRD